MNLITENFNSSTVRILLIDGKEWFIAKDIATLLGYSNTKKAVIEHTKKSRIMASFKRGNESLPLDPQTKLIPESDVWRLIIKSKLPEAERIEEWIFEEVLPSIRKTGSYSKKPKDIDIEYLRKRTEQIETSGKQLISFKKTFYEIGIKREEELIVTSNRAVAKETGIDFIELAELKGVSTPDIYFTVTELCQKVMNSDKFDDEAKKLVSTKRGDKPRPQNLNKLLEENGFQTKVDGIWKPTKKAKDFSDFVQNKSKHSDKTVFHTVWKFEVLEELFPEVGRELEFCTNR
jgi:prophage antirepressor-like protein